jgi:hypothetical protein
MRRKKVGAIAIKSFALLVVLGTAYQARAPIEQYLMTDRDAEIALGTKFSAGVHFTRCRGTGSRTSWFRNSGERQERFRVYRGTFVDRRSGC